MAQTVTTSNGVTARQEQFIGYLLAGAKLPAAAKQSGVSERQAQRWFKLPAVQTLYQETQQAAFEEALGALRTGVSTAIKTLLKAMVDDDTPPYVRVQAAAIWLDKAVELHKMSVLEARLCVLEDHLKERQEP